MRGREEEERLMFSEYDRALEMAPGPAFARGRGLVGLPGSSGSVRGLVVERLVGRAGMDGRDLGGPSAEVDGLEAKTDAAECFRLRTADVVADATRDMPSCPRDGILRAARSEADDLRVRPGCGEGCWLGPLPLLGPGMGGGRVMNEPVKDRGAPREGLSSGLSISYSRDWLMDTSSGMSSSSDSS